MSVWNVWIVCMECLECIDGMYGKKILILEQLSYHGDTYVKRRHVNGKTAGL